MHDGALPVCLGRIVDGLLNSGAVGTDLHLDDFALPPRRRLRQTRDLVGNILGGNDLVTDATESAPLLHCILRGVTVAHQRLIAPGHAHAARLAGQAKTVVHHKVGTRVVKDRSPVAGRFDHAIAGEAHR